MTSDLVLNYGRSASDPPSTTGIWRGEVTSISGDDYEFVIPRLTGVNASYKATTSVPVANDLVVGDNILLSFSEGRNDEIAVLGKINMELGSVEGYITGVTAGTNLNGGGTTGDVTLNLDADITLDSVTATDVYANLFGPTHIKVKNTSGGVLSKGAAVYATGSVGASGAVEVQASDADNASTMPALGLLDQQLADNGEGSATVLGIIRQVDTSAYSVNDELYVSTTPGALTDTRPTGATELVQKIGRVVRVNASTGEILVLGAGRTNDVPNGTLANDISGNAATATTWASDLTISLGTDLSGSVTFNGDEGTVTLNASVANDSHTHDTRYYTETESDAKYLLNTTDTLSGNLTVTGIIDVDEVRGDNGTNADPTFTFTDDQDTGMYRYGANAIGFTAGGGLKVLIDSSGTYGRLFGPGFRSGSAIIRGENTAALPTYTFYGDENTGMYWQSSDVIAWSTGGTKRALLYSGGFRINVSGSAGTPAFHWEGDTNTGMYRVTTDQVGFSAGGTLKGRFWSQGLLMGSASTGNAQLGTGTGSAGSPVYHFYNDTNTGMYRSGTDQISFSTAGSEAVRIPSAGDLRMQREGIVLDVSQKSYWAVNPITGTGNDAEWASAFGYYYLRRNSSVAADKVNITSDLGAHLTADMIDQVVPKMWARSHSSEYPEIGPIADDMDLISPFLVTRGTDADGEVFMNGIDRNAYISLLVLAIKDLRARVAALEAG